MKAYRIVKQEGTQREILGETATELDIQGRGLLVLKGDFNDADFDAFKREWEKSMKDNPMSVLVMPDDVEIEYVRLEEVGAE